MANYKRILVATDLSTDSKELFKKASALSNSYNAVLHLIHVIENTTLYADDFSIPLDPESQSEMDKKSVVILEKVAEKLEINPKNCRVCYGSIKKEVIDYALEVKADLIVVGAHESNMVDRLLGSQANAILRHAECDVWVVRLADRN